VTKIHFADDSIPDDTADHVVPPTFVVLPRGTESPLRLNEFELEIAAVVDSTQTSEVHFIGEVGVHCIWSNEGAGVSFVFGTVLDAIFGFAAGLIVVFDFLAGHGGAFWVWWWPFR